MDIEYVYSFKDPLPDGDRHTMRYSAYKKHYSDCKTVPGTYDKDLKTIDVIVPEGRMKPSGVRGKRYMTIWLMVGDDEGRLFKQGFKAMSLENAVKQAKKYYKYVEHMRA